MLTRYPYVMAVQPGRDRRKWWDVDVEHGGDFSVIDGQRFRHAEWNLFFHRWATAEEVEEHVAAFGAAHRPRDSRLLIGSPVNEPPPAPRGEAGC